MQIQHDRESVSPLTVQSK